MMFEDFKEISASGFCPTLGKWLCDMLNFLFLFTETHVSCGSCYTSDRIIFHAWLKLLYGSDKLSGITQHEVIY